MPLRIITKNERIDLPVSGEWVDVKAQLSREDRNYIRGAAMRMNMEIDTATRQAKFGNVAVETDANGNLTAKTLPVSVDLGDVLNSLDFLTMERAIVAWSFDVPVTKENIRLLDDESIDYIKEQLNRLYTVRTDEEKKT